MSDLIAKKRSKKKTTEVKRKKTEDEKIRDQVLRDSKPQRGMGGEGANTLFRRKTDQDKRKRRNKRQRDVPRGNTKHKKDLRDRAASVARRYLEREAGFELLLDPQSRGDEVEPCGQDANVALIELLEGTENSVTVKSATQVQRLYKLRDGRGSDNNVTVEVINIVPGVGPTDDILYYLDTAAKDAAKSAGAVLKALERHPEIRDLKGWDQYLSASGPQEGIKVHQMISFKKVRALSEDLLKQVKAALGDRQRTR